MSYLRVDTEIMAQGATRIQNAIDDIDNVLNLLGSDVAAMLNAWQGDAASAHQKMHERFDKDAKTIRESLTQMCGALLRTHSIYVTQESEQTGDQYTMSNQILT